MTDREWQRAKELLARAMKAPAPTTPEPVTDAGPPRPQAAGGPTPRGAGDADGHVWGDFVLLEQLGRGGFGVVYRAWERPLRREVALKLIETTLYPKRRESIQLEGQMLARIDHPNVVRIYGIHKRDDDLAIAMEYIRGRTLANVVEVDGPFSPREAAQTAATVAGALMAVHRGGLLHRDIKASNVMRAHDGRVVLMDFGAGRDLHREPDTSTRMIGTPVYMAPEILAGGHATPASDVYSLGVLTYYLLKGEYPTPGPGMRTGQHPDAWATQALTTAPEALAVMVGRMLAAEPAQRPAIDAALRRLLTRSAPKPPSSRSKSTTRRTGDPAKPAAADQERRTPASLPETHTPSPSVASTGPLTWQRVAAGVIASLLLSAAVGVLSMAESNQVLGRHGHFANDPPSVYLGTGLSAMVMPIALTCLVAVAFAGLLLIWRVACAIDASPARWLCGVASTAGSALARRGLLTRGTVEQMVAVLGLAAFIAVLTSYHDLLAALTSRLDDGPREVFGALNSHLEDNSTFRALLLHVLLALVASRFLTRRLPDDATSRVSSLGVLGVSVLIGIVLAASYRVMETRPMRMVLYGADTCYVLGEHQREWLLHCPTLAPPRNRVVATDDPKVRTSKDTGVPFDAYPLVPGYVPTLKH